MRDDFEILWDFQKKNLGMCDTCPKNHSDSIEDSQFWTR